MSQLILMFQTLAKVMGLYLWKPNLSRARA